MTELCCLGHPFLYEMECTLRVFFPGERIAVIREPPSGERFVCAEVERQGDVLLARVRVHLPEAGETAEARLSPDTSDLEIERRLSLLLFEILCAATGTRPAWGILTGVRPLRLMRRMERAGAGEEEILRRFAQDYLVRPEKARLALETMRAQREILAKNAPGSFSLYVSIPFCPSRCLYCSFVSHAVENAERLVPDYVERLCEEIRYTGAVARELGLTLLTVYFGGGTPTSLTAGQLGKALRAVEESFDLSHLMEYTVEAGRPDTISREKLAVLADHGVGRLSVNPQSMEDAVLRAVGRRHTAAQVVESYILAREMGFQNINMDLIAGLPGDTAESFSRTVEKVLALAPENITLHALTVKRSSALRKQEGAFRRHPLDLQALLDGARAAFGAAGYRPYYLYRQKGTVQNLENTAYTLPGKESAYNIFSMEDVQTILGVGAGAVTKLCRGGEPYRRLFTLKYPYEYLDRFGEILLRKAQLSSILKI